MGDEYFVGRRDESARFAALLADVTIGGKSRTRRWRAHQRSGRQAGSAQSRVVLVHGLGGSGKSQLLRHFREMTQGRVLGWPVLANRVEAVWLDWEDERRDNPSSYAAVAGPSLVTILDAVQKAVIAVFRDSARAAERASRAFDDYRQGATRMPEYAARFVDVLTENRLSAKAFTGEDAAALARAAVSAGLVVSGHPAGFLGLMPEQLSAAAQAGGHLSAAATRAVTGKRPGELSSQDYELVTDPLGELIRRAAAGVQVVAAQRPLVILLDTGEVIGDRAWGWLRRLMGHTGPAVTWVIGARFETEAEAGTDSPVAQFVREVGDEHLMLMSPTRFDDMMIRSYLERRNAVRAYSEPEIDLIAGFTRGLPLAVSFAATLLDQGQPVQEACQEFDDGQPNNAVSRLARRYLVHAEQQTFLEDDPRRYDVMKILGLALAFGDVRKDPEVLAALWNVEPVHAQAAFADLARRHDFVLPVSHRLHDDVRDTLRTDLLDPFQRARAEQINHRALTLFKARLERMRRRWPGLDDQIAHAAFTTSLLAALWHTLWADNQAGLDLFIHLLPVFAVADPPAADAATEIIEHFAVTFDSDQRRDLDLLTQSSADDLLLNRRSRPRIERRVKITRAGLALESLGPEEKDVLIGEPVDRHVAVLILKAALCDEDDQEKFQFLQIAASQAKSTRLQRAIGTQAQAITIRLLWDGQPRTSKIADLGLKASELAIKMLPDNASAWESYGAALDEVGRQEDARAAHGRAREIDPAVTRRVRAQSSATAPDLDDSYLEIENPIEKYEPINGFGLRASGLSQQGQRRMTLGRPQEALAAYDQEYGLSRSDLDIIKNRGHALYAQGRHEEALAAYDQAAQLLPGQSIVHKGRGNVLRDLGRYEEALAAYDQAYGLSSRDPDIIRNRALMLVALGRYEEALGAYGKVFARNDPAAYRRKGNVLRDLGRYEEALAAYDQALALDPNDADAFEKPALMLMALGRYEEALNTYGHVLQLRPDYTAARESKGIALTALGYLDHALAEFHSAELLQPEGAGTGRVWAGAILWHQNDALGAQRKFALVEGKVLDRTPFYTAEMESIALLGLDRPNDAKKHLLDALSLRTPRDRAEPRKIYDLLTDPPLTGIDHLRMIVLTDPPLTDLDRLRAIVDNELIEESEFQPQ